MCIDLSPEVDTSYQDYQRAEAERARAEQKALDARIQRGMDQINAVFTGGSVPTMLTAPEAVNFGTSQDPRWRVQSGTFGDPVSYAGVDPLLQQREQAQLDYYMPQLDEQAADTKDDLTYALARAGQLTSTTAGERQADLTEEMALQKGNILSQIASDIAGQRTLLNQQRSSAEAALRASGDASSAVDQALTGITSFQQDMPELDPLGPLFASIATGIGAAQQGYQTQQVRNASTPRPLTSGSGRNVV